MKRVITITVSLLMLAAMAGCSKAAAVERAEDQPVFDKVSDPAQRAQSEEPSDAPESEPEPISDEFSDEAEEVSETWDSEDYSGSEYVEDYEYEDYEYEDYGDVGYYEPDYSAYNTDGPSYGMPGYYDGHVETYYNASSHFMSGDWTLDDEGFYHDENGRYVIGVGADDMDSMPYGTVVQTGRGEAVVYDYGTATGVHDFATNW